MKPINLKIYFTISFKSYFSSLAVADVNFIFDLLQFKRNLEIINFNQNKFGNSYFSLKARSILFVEYKIWM